MTKRRSKRSWPGRRQGRLPALTAQEAHDLRSALLHAAYASEDHAKRLKPGGQKRVGLEARTRRWWALWARLP